jgi:class 3 adenylate cyclase/tetratricopeptide (TPR) repeat protein
MVRKTVTLVFCDVADSTPLGEQLDPEALRGVWSRYHETARDVLERHGGTVEKFIGDAVMAAFGIPLVHEDDPLRAVRAAAELRDSIAQLNDELERTSGIRIAVRFGVNTGEVFAGDPEQGQAFATGDAVTVAQRLESAAPPDEILVSDATLRLVRDAVRAERVPALELKGKSAPVAAWRLLAVEPEAALGVARRMDAPFVGRAAELARLQEELAAAVEERSCRVATIVGEPGVGKSRLAAELIAAGEGRLEVLEGRCLPYGNGITYWPLVEIVRRLDLDDVLDGEEDAEVVHGRILEAVGRADARARSDELYWAVRRLFEAIARRRPLLVVLDDIQWAEPAFLDLIEYLEGWSRDAPILLCCLARTDLLDVRPGWGGSATISLAALPRSELQTLIEHLAGPLDAGAVEALGRATGGNPLFLEEMLRMLVEDGVLVEHDGRLESRTAVEALPVPETVQAVLAARLDRLGPEELAVLQRASVIGQVFWWGAVAALTPDDEAATVAATLQALVRKGLIRPDRRTFAGEDGFRFGHILIRDAAYDSMAKRQRAELHERCADWVQERAGEGGELDEILGHHLEQAHLYLAELGPADPALAGRAATLLTRAGRRAFAREDPHAAASLLGRATALLDPGAEELPAVLLEHATALHRAGRLDEAVELFDRLQDAATPPRVAAAAQLERAFLRISSGEGSVDEVLDAAERATTVFAELGDDAGLAQAWNSVATQFFWRGLTGQMEEAALRALAHARAAADVSQELWAQNALCIALAHGPTPADEAARRCRELLARGEELGADALPLFTLAAVEAMRGRLTEAWDLYDRGVARGVRGVRASVSLYAHPLFELDPTRAEDALRATLRTLDEIGIRTGRRTAAVMLAEALLARDASAEAEAWLESPDAIVFPAEDVTTSVLARRVEARLLGGAAGAAKAAEAVAAARETESPLLLAGALVVLSEVGGGSEPMAEAAALWEAKGNVLALRRLDTAPAAR